MLLFGGTNLNQVRTETNWNKHKTRNFSKAALYATTTSKPDSYRGIWKSSNVLINKPNSQPIQSGSIRDTLTRPCTRPGYLVSPHMNTLKKFDNLELKIED